MGRFSTNHDKIFLEHIVRNIPQYTFWKDVNSVYLGCNANYARLLGLKSPLEIVGKTDMDIGWLPDGDSAELFRQGDKETMAGKAIKNQEEWLSLPNGTKILVLVNKAPILDDAGCVIGVLGVATDITEKKRIEQELLETQHKLQGMTLVSASIAHELRTPLAAITAGMSGLETHLPLLLHAYEMAEKASLPIQKIRSSLFEILQQLPALVQTETTAASTFIDMLLTNLNPPTDKVKEEIFLIADCVNEALSRYPFQMDQRKLIHWEAKDDFQVQGQNLLVIHILFNLIKNALYYIVEARKGDIEIKLKRGKPYNILYFKDSGTGIAEDILPYIFDRFFSRTYHGAGIGLTFCKAAMESLGGDITCESQKGSYTQFTLRFPNLH